MSALVNRNRLSGSAIDRAWPTVLPARSSAHQLARGLFAVNATGLVAILAVGLWFVWRVDLRGGEWLAFWRWEDEPLALTLVFGNVLTCAALSMLVMTVSQGRNRAVLLLALCFLIAGGIELLGITVGFPFGARYQYSDVLGPRFAGRLPYLIPAAWFMMLYPALHLGFSLPIPRWQAPIVAAVLMTLWDVALDPALTASGFELWTWHHDGGVYGIPVQNWSGWFVTAWLVGECYRRLVRNWRPDGLQLPAAVYVSQSIFIAVVAAVMGRPGATVAWAAFAVLIAGMYRAANRPVVQSVSVEAVPSRVYTLGQAKGRK